MAAGWDKLNVNLFIRHEVLEKLGAFIVKATDKHEQTQQFVQGLQTRPQQVRLLEEWDLGMLSFLLLLHSYAIDES